MSEEIWKSVLGCRGVYEVSNLGRVRSNVGGTPRILKQQDRNGRGQMCVTLSHEVKGGRSYYVSHLVADAFLGVRPQKARVQHIDGDPTNNRADNLRYSGQAELEELRRELRAKLLASFN